jgi:phosphate ABC transporter phosphate-binding protein
MSAARLLPVLLVAATGCAGDDGIVEVNAQGATFVEPIMKVWTNKYLDRTGDKVRINYQGTGSGAGITQMTKQTVAFGCSDAPMNKKQVEEATAAGGAVVHVPLVIGAVVPMYNVPGVEKPLTFTGPLLADLFTGRVKKWNDPKLLAANPGVPLPDLDVQPVFRADPSGTSFIFSDYLCKVSPEFQASVGTSTAPNWPKAVGIKQNKSDGVAGHISRTAGAIGYVELTYALDTKARYGSVVNKAGKPVRADLDSITAAAAATLGMKQTADPYSLHELTYNLTDAPGDASYPIAGMSFAVLYAQQSGPAGQAVVDFLTWCTSEVGQGMAKTRNYAPLPAELQAKAADRLKTVQVN